MTIHNVVGEGLEENSCINCGQSAPKRIQTGDYIDQMVKPDWSNFPRHIQRDSDCVTTVLCFARVRSCSSKTDLCTPSDQTLHNFTSDPTLVCCYTRFNSYPGFTWLYTLLPLFMHLLSIFTKGDEAKEKVIVSEAHVINTVIILLNMPSISST